MDQTKLGLLNQDWTWIRLDPKLDQIRTRTLKRMVNQNLSEIAPQLNKEIATI